MQQFADRADYYSWIVESAERRLEKRPNDVLHHEVTPSISGGHAMWDHRADDLYQNPKTLEEALLAQEMRWVLRCSIENLLKVVRVRSREVPVKLNLFKLPMDFSMLVGTATKYAVRDVHSAMLVKIEMAKIASIADRRSLADFLGKYCLFDPDAGDKYCALF